VPVAAIPVSLDVDWAMMRPPVGEKVCFSNQEFISGAHKPLGMLLELLL